MEIQLKLIGGLLLVLAAVHGVFPRYFSWTTELAGLRLINRQLMYVHTFFVALTVGLMGLLCLTSATELANTVLGHRVCAGLGLFWGLRLLTQFFGYSASLWRGRVFETTVHIVFTILWVYLTVVFCWVASAG